MTLASFMSHNGSAEHDDIENNAQHIMKRKRNNGQKYSMEFKFTCDSHALGN